MKLTNILIAYGLLVTISIISIITTLMKRKIMIGYGDLALKKFFSFKLWSLIFANKYMLLVLFLGFIMFILNAVILSFTRVHSLLIFSWTMVIPVFLVTMYSSYKILGEEITRAQYPFIGILIISMILSFIGMYGYIKVS